MRLNSIRTRTAIILLSLGVLIVLMVGGLWVYTTYTSMMTDIRQSNLEDARTIAGYVDVFMNNIVIAERVTAGSQDTIDAVRSNDTGRLKAIGDNMASTIPDLDVAVILDTNASVLYHSKGANTTGFIHSGWYDLARKQNGTFITGLYYSESLQDHVFSVSVPVIDRGSTVGYIIASADPRRLDREIQQRQTSPDRNILIVDRLGVVVSHDERTNVEKNSDFSYATPVRKVINGTEGLMETSETYDGQYRIVGFSPVPLSGWGVIVTTPVTVVYEQIFRRILGILALLLGLSPPLMVVSYIVSRYLTAPIVELSDTMRRVSAGSLHERARTERKDEIGDLSRTFNSMMDDLERTTELERTVEISRKYQLIFQRARDAILFTDITGRVLDANRAACELYGYTKDELLTKTVSDFRLPDDRSGAPDMLRKCYDQGCFYQTSVVRKDGSIFLAEVSSAGASIRNKPVLVAIVRDVTDRVEREKELRLARFSLDHAIDMIFFIQEDGRIFYANQSACRQYGYSCEELRSMTVQDINSAYGPEGWQARWNAIKEKGSLSYETENRSRDGRVFPIEVAASYIRFGDLELVCAYGRDITERKRSQKALADAKGQSDLYVDIMAHDINNLNQVALMNLEVLQLEETLTDDEQETINGIQTAIYGSIDLIENVRKIQKIASGELHPEPVDIAGMISKCIEEAKLSALSSFPPGRQS